MTKSMTLVVPLGDDLEKGEARGGKYLSRRPDGRGGCPGPGSGTVDPGGGSRRVRENFPADYLWSFGREPERLSGYIRQQIDHYDVDVGRGVGVLLEELRDGAEVPEDGDWRIGLGAPCRYSCPDDVVVVNRDDRRAPSAGG